MAIPTISREKLVRAPGMLKYGADVYLYSLTPIEVNLVTVSADVVVDGVGRVRRHVQDRYLEITCTPPEFEAFNTLMLPYATMPMGASIFGATTDTALVLHTRNGKSYTFHAAAPTAFGIMGKAAGAPLLGQLTFTAVLKNNAKPGDAGAYYTLDTAAAYPGDANFSRAACITPSLSCSWGAAPFEAFHIEDALDIAFALELQPETVGALGTVDMKFVNCIVNARGVPVGLTMSELYTAADAGQAFGEQRTENDLILSGNGFYFAAYNAQLEDPNVGFSATRRVPGQANWTTNRSLTAGAIDAAFFIGTAAPEA